MTPENAGFYHAAYVIAFVAYAVYTVTLWRRRARVREALRRAQSIP